MAIAATETPQKVPEMDEAQCRAALARLDQLRQTLDEVRLAIPDILSTLNDPHASPARFLANFTGAAVDAQKRLETFKATWRNEATQELFERARQSLQANSDLSAAATVPMYGWTETDLMDSEKADDASSARALEHGIVEDGVHFDQVDVARVVDDFRKAHPNFNVDLEVWRKENWVINIQYQAPRIFLRFSIRRYKGRNDEAVLVAECLGEMKLFPAITRCLASRPDPNNLPYLLEMIAAYTNTKTVRCVKCNHGIEYGAAISPAARRSRQVKNADGVTTTVWDAFHESCLPTPHS